MRSLLELEFYPRISSSELENYITRFKNNKNHWNEPFFMDVYSYVDVDEIKRICNPILERSPKNMVILGTGGSIQTTMALEGLLQRDFYPVVSSRPRELHQVLRKCSPQETIVIPISRGGETLDVNSTIEVFASYPMLGLSSQGPMYAYLKKKEIPILPVPDLSGRFAASISNVALVPAYLGGIDIDLFLRSLQDAYSEYKMQEHHNINLAMQLAIYLFVHYAKGFRNCFIMPYSSYLEGSAGLFVQEISESSGKENAGMMGTKQEAPLCQHSVLELLLGGSKGHTIPFLWTTRSEPRDVEIHNASFGLENQTALKIINHQADATFQALLTQKVPSAMLNLKEITIQGMAQLIAFIQSTIYYFCVLLDVNWENNPLVNTGKSICNKAIQSNLSVEQRKAQRKKIASEQFSDD
ncbi:MAG: hypothetical protein JW776_10385 [Candidatus Lokiarchaeota archaeon]|nr:hypothetical protein [Candidatus Lokiarchaeota archaeon]